MEMQVLMTKTIVVMISNILDVMMRMWVGTTVRWSDDDDEDEGYGEDNNEAGDNVNNDNLEDNGKGAMMKKTVLIWMAVGKSDYELVNQIVIGSS